jgi:hypothetical protein
MADVFSDLKMYPYWWEAAPRPEETLIKLPGEVDALIVGGGFSGATAPARATGACWDRASTSSESKV